MKKIRYIEEIYTDEYITLYQSIMWDVVMDKATDGMESRYWKSKINPNLKILLKRRYLNENYKLVKEEKFGGNEDECFVSFKYGS